MSKRLNLNEESRVLVLTGAGVSAESGVPTFRDSNGLWENHDVTDVASPEGFERDPSLVWRFYSQRREGAAKVHPNAGHVALAQLEQQLGSRFLLATQNVDGLHARAGSKRMIAIHGELFETRCVSCAEPFADTKTYFDAPMPSCTTCQSALRPNIVWFGEMLDPAHLKQVGRFIEEAGRHLVFMAIGTSGMVFPAAGFVDAARAVGGKTWLVDAAPSAEFAARFDEVVVGKSGEVLPELFRLRQ
ncbi:MAG: SIR2 family NAD-dependent protein deacylase [Archangium sp.]